ncbi:bifunctional metallophosphatase/5'-nucleotidase [Salipaludibacillus daqingensis]|uniref:bifunctional metallophosphatase/5'-nucleotidase n=1 Tax=Salipaludibacillus daqingensis TaxID=3041001 RepID=UPI0024762B30|nr:5'-nucleotidase C-terminal domain-containing protein [Salipaludibacillus daqingensis]
MKYRSKMNRKFIVATMSVALIVSSFAPMASANPGNGNGNGNGQATSEERGNNGNNSQGPKRAIEDVEILDSTSFKIDFDKTYPKGLDINRMIDVEVELEDETVVPELTNYEVSSDDRSHVIVEHGNDDLDGLVGTLSINNFEVPFDYVEDAEETFELSVLHTNDLHGRVNMYPQLITTANEARETRPDALLLEAGDIFSGTLYFNEFRGQAALEFMNLMDYDAFVFGNHEFDLGDPEEGHPDLVKFVENANFPFLGANMDFSGHPEFDALTSNKDGITYEAEGGMIYDGIVKEVNGEEVGIFGINTEDTADISSPINVTFSDFADASAQMVEQFEDAGVNKIIALTHLGFDSDPSVGNDLRLAAEVEGIDIIVGGHSHDALHDPVAVTENEAGEEMEPTVIVQANEYGNYIGTLDVTFDSEGVLIDWEGELLDARDREADPYAAELLEPYTEAIEKVQNEPAGFTLNEELPNPRLGDGSDVSVRANETKLGNLIADGFLRAGKRANSDTVISFQNGGGIRAALPAGDVTVGELITVQPFGNRLTLLELSGAEIIEALELSVKDVPGENGGFLHVSGMKFTFDSSQPAGERVQTVEVKQGEEYVALEMDEMYVTAMNNFTATGGDGYSVFGEAYDEGRGTIVGDTDWEILRNHALKLVEEVGEVKPEIEGRIIDVNSSDE